MGDIRKIGYFSWIIAEFSRTSQPLILECSHTLQHTSSSLNMLKELICYELAWTWTEMWEHLQLSWLCCDCDILIPFGLERKTSFKRPVWEINENVTTGRQTSQLRQLWTRWPGQRSRGSYKLYKHFLITTRHPPTCKTISRAFSDVLCSIQRICAVVVLAYSAVLWTEGPLPFWMHSTLLDRNAKINDKFWLKLVYKVQKLIGSLRQRW